MAYRVAKGRTKYDQNNKQMHTRGSNVNTTAEQMEPDSNP